VKHLNNQVINGTNAMLLVHLLTAIFCTSAWADVNDDVRKYARDTYEGYTAADKQEASRKIGELGRDAIPELRNLLASDDWLKQSSALTGIHALGAIGVEMLSDLLAALQRGHRFTRAKAAHVIGDLGPSAAVATPALIALTDDKDLSTRIAAIVALGKINGEAESTLAALLRQFEGPERFPEGVLPKTYAAASLGLLGATASPAVPSLVRLASSTRRQEIRDIAEEAAEQIGAPTARGVAERFFAKHNQVVNGDKFIARGWQGRNSRIAEKNVARILSEEDWAGLWVRHGRGLSDLPSVNFSKSMILALWLGLSANAEQFRITEISISNGTGHLAYSFMYSDAYDTPGNRQFIFVEVPRTLGEFSIEERTSVAMSKDGGKSERIVARFPAIK